MPWIRAAQSLQRNHCRRVDRTTKAGLRESRVRVLAARSNSDFTSQIATFIVNLAPADVRVFQLAIALPLLAAHLMSSTESLADTRVAGELRSTDNCARRAVCSASVAAHARAC